MKNNDYHETLWLKIYLPRSVLLFISFWFLSNVGSSEAFQNEEKQALLDFKSNINRDPLKVL
jgi:hypothetical protein